MTHSATQTPSAARARALPFSRRAGAAELEACARRFVGALGLRADVRVVRGGGAAGLEAERRFRLAWWARGADPLRASLQRMKVRVFREAETRRETALLADAWRRAEREVSSAPWRARLHELAGGLGAADAALLRLAFRAAQQGWSREARWRAVVRGGEPSPFAPMLELFSAGAWPLGCHDGVVSVLVWEEGARGTPAHAPPPHDPRAGEGASDYVFLSAKFSDRTLTRRWESALASAGWATLHGPVSEEDAAPEAQLGARIRAARAVVGICDSPDPDFGLPWWMFQELDYARACGLPVFLVSRGDSLAAGRGRLEELCGARVPDGGDAEPGLRSWLEADAARLWGKEG